MPCAKSRVNAFVCVHRDSRAHTVFDLAARFITSRPAPTDAVEDAPARKRGIPE